MLGNDTSVYTVNNKAAQIALDLRNALSRVETFNIWLQNNPPVNGDDPLVALGFAPGEAVILRTYFEQMDEARTAYKSTLDLGRHLTNLE